MNTYKHIWMAALAALIVLTTPTTALAQEFGPNLPPPPDWPIIGPVLRWLGFEGTPEPTPAFDPNRPEHRLATIAEAEALWNKLSPDERVRVIISQADANAQLQESIRNARGLSSASITFDAGAITLAATVDRAALELEGVELPFFLMGKEISGQVTFTLNAVDCRPTFTVKKVRIGRLSLPLRTLAQTTLDENLAQEWPPNICIERVFMLPGEFAVEGYRR